MSVKLLYLMNIKWKHMAWLYLFYTNVILTYLSPVTCHFRPKNKWSQTFILQLNAIHVDRIHVQCIKRFSFVSKSFCESISWFSVFLMSPSGAPRGWKDMIIICIFYFTEVCSVSGALEVNCWPWNRRAEVLSVFLSISAKAEDLGESSWCRYADVSWREEPSLWQLRQTKENFSYKLFKLWKFNLTAH